MNISHGARGVLFSARQGAVRLRASADRSLAAGFAAALLVSMAACGGGSDDPAPVPQPPGPTVPVVPSPPPPLPPPAPSTFTVGGVLDGLAPGASLALSVLDASGNDLQTASLSQNGSYSVGTVPAGTTYNVQIVTQPQGQNCTVTNGMGTVSADVSSIRIDCAASVHSLGGQVTGWNRGLVLVNTVTGESVTRNAVGPFTFAQRTPYGSRYDVRIASVSAGQSCTVNAGQGVVQADVTSIVVNCQPDVVVPPPPPPPPPPLTPTNLSVTYGVKAYKLAWDSSASATRYEVAEDPDGAGPEAEAAVNGAIAPVAGAVQGSTVNLPNLIKRVNAQYRVRACNVSGCSAYTAALTPNLTDAIGYFKASNTHAADSFGFSVALSGNGNTLAVGAYMEDSRATGIGGNQADKGAPWAGAVYIFTHSSGIWSQQAYVKASNTGVDDGFGSSIALSADGNTLAVGAPREDSGAIGMNGDDGDESVLDAGAVYVFTRSASTWSQQAYVKASNTGVNDGFGSAIALSGDGNTLAVGAQLEDSDATGIGSIQTNSGALNAGAVYVFARSASAWSQQAYVKASNSRESTHFGASIVLSADGTTLVVGATGDRSKATGVNGDQADYTAVDAGAVYVFTRSGSTWSQQAYLKGSNTAAGDALGARLALSADGDTLAVTTVNEDSKATGINGDQADNNAPWAGAVYVFTRSSGTWSQQAYVKASNTDALDYFGWSVALSADGTTLAVGAPGESSTAAGIGGTQADNSAAKAGAVYVFSRSGEIWSQKAFVKASNTEAEDGFGRSVALSSDGNTLAVGAFGENSNATGIGGNQADNSALSAGAVYVY